MFGSHVILLYNGYNFFLSHLLFICHKNYTFVPMAWGLYSYARI